MASSASSALVVVLAKGVRTTAAGSTHDGRIRDAGLANMRDQVVALSGSPEITSASGAGTAIRVRAQIALQNGPA